MAEAGQFTDIYNLGQLSPSPNINMMTVIGYQVSGSAGAFLVLLAFYLPRALSYSQ